MATTEQARMTDFSNDELHNLWHTYPQRTPAEPEGTRLQAEVSEEIERRVEQGVWP